MWALNSDEYYENRITELEKELSDMSVIIMNKNDEIKKLKEENTEIARKVWHFKDNRDEMETSLHSAMTQLNILGVKLIKAENELETLKEDIKLERKFGVDLHAC